MLGMQNSEAQELVADLDRQLEEAKYNAQQEIDRLEALRVQAEQSAAEQKAASDQAIA